MHPELSALSRFSAKLGRNRLLVQAASGNTSIKLGSELWVKASGAWLADADRNDIFLPVDLAKIRGCIEKGVPYRAEYRNGAGARLEPSVEAPLHAVMPHRVVIHVHAINTICWALRDDGPSHLLGLLNGLSWRWIPYLSSGLPLALALRRLASSAAPDVLVLANHGLVLGADSFEAAEALLIDIENRLSLRPRTGPEPSWSQLQGMAAADPCWRVPVNSDIHALGTDAASRAILAAGALYPCQVVFLGPSASVAPGASVADAEARHVRRHGIPPKLLIVEGSGVLVRPRMSVAETQVLEGLSQVVRRLDATDPIRYLTPADLADLHSADAHAYLGRVENSCLESSTH